MQGGFGGWWRGFARRLVMRALSLASSYLPWTWQIFSGRPSPDCSALPTAVVTTWGSSASDCVVWEGYRGYLNFDLIDAGSCLCLLAFVSKCADKYRGRILGDVCGRDEQYYLNSGLTFFFTLELSVSWVRAGVAEVDTTPVCCVCKMELPLRLCNEVFLLFS